MGPVNLLTVQSTDIIAYVYRCPEKISILQEEVMYMGLSPDTQNCGLRMRRECRERCPRHRGLAIPSCIMSRCLSESLTSGFLWSRWRGKRSRHSRRMRNPQFCEPGKRPIKHLIVLAVSILTPYCSNVTTYRLEIEILIVSVKNKIKHVRKANIIVRISHCIKSLLGTSYHKSGIDVSANCYIICIV